MLLAIDSFSHNTQDTNTVASTDMPTHCALLALAAALITPTHASLDLAFGDDSDLTNFVTRPEIKTPKFNVSIYDDSQIAPGYWFVAPYAMIFQQPHAHKYYQPCQTGPTIYDNRGELVWSGACKVKNQNTCDFRAWQFNDTLYTSAILTPYRDAHDPQGHGIIMDKSFSEVGEIRVPPTEHNINMHELNLVDNGAKVLHIAHEPASMNLSQLQPGLEAGWILDIGFREVDMHTGQPTFEWWAYRGGHVDPITDSKVPFKGGESRPQAWNWFHGNSVEKNAEGDYMLSSRFTDAIYKISGKDGSIIWRLGGSKSSFTQDFTFSRQHDARWLSSSGDKEIISFLNNQADDVIQNAPHSTAVIVELDTSSMTAKVLKSIDRPDKGLTRMRGNHQVLPNGNSFVCWSENSYMSEHNSEGKLLMEAKFASNRFVTYRAYKFDFFDSVPDEPIVLKAAAYGTSAKSSTTVAYVSWNGATNVASWRLKTVDGTTIGEKKRTGFETTFQVNGYHSDVVVEAISANGTTIGSSGVEHAVAPSDWEAETAEKEGSVQPASKKDSVTDDILVFALFLVLALTLGFGLWLWRCSNGGRSSVRLDGYSIVPVDKC